MSSRVVPAALPPQNTPLVERPRKNTVSRGAWHLALTMRIARAANRFWHNPRCWCQQPANRGRQPDVIAHRRATLADDGPAPVGRALDPPAAVVPSLRLSGPSSGWAHPSWPSNWVTHDPAESLGHSTTGRARAVDLWSRGQLSTLHQQRRKPVRMAATPPL